MTDEEIKQIEEVVKRSKYCNKFYKENNCNNHCPLRFKNEPYDLGFLDGFKAAMEYFNQIIKKLNTDGKFDDDFNYSGGYQRAFEDIQEELGI